MDPIAILQSRIEQLEAKLGLNTKCEMHHAHQHEHQQHQHEHQQHQHEHQQHQHEHQQHQHEHQHPADNQHQHCNVHYGDSATANLVQAAQAMNNATAGQEKLSEAMNVASELNNYTDPHYIENRQQNEMHMQEVVAAEPVLHHHCQCMHRCKEAEPMLESEPILKAPQMQATVDKIQAQAHEVRLEADAVSHGVQELAETCGQAASNASEQLAAVSQNVDQVEEKKLPKRRNGLD